MQSFEPYPGHPPTSCTCMNLQIQIYRASEEIGTLFAMHADQHTSNATSFTSQQSEKKVHTKWSERHAGDMLAAVQAQHGAGGPHLPLDGIHVPQLAANPAVGDGGKLQLNEAVAVGQVRDSRILLLICGPAEWGQ